MLDYHTQPFADEPVVRGGFPDDAARCPFCGQDNEPMGGLGSVLWFRCRACGIDYTEA